MKLILIISVLFFGFINIQAQSDTSGTKDKEVKNKIQLQNNELDKVQKNIGPKDNPGANKKLKGKDVFIDKDGDGICDTRQSGMSFHKLRKRQGKQGGDHGGGGNGNGGNNQNGNRR